MYTDEYILKLIKHDREKGAKILVEQYSALLSSICAGKLQNPEDIEECVNDTFAEFFLHPDLYSKTKGSLKSYLCTIAKHKAIDKFRKNCRKAELEKLLLAKHKEDHANAALRSNESSQLDDALEKLPPLDQKILEMHYYDDKSYKEISKELGVSYEKVRKRGMRGRKKLLYLILLGILIFGITACTTIIMKEEGLLPKWFPFYEWIPGKAPEPEPDTSDPPEIVLNIEHDNQLKDETNTKVDPETTSLPEISIPENSSSRTYYVSDKHGILDADSPAYRLIDNNQKFERNGVTYEIDDAFYQGGKLEITYLVTLLDESRRHLDELPGLTASQEEIQEYLSKYPHEWMFYEDIFLKKAYIFNFNGEKILSDAESGTRYLSNDFQEYASMYSFSWTPEKEDTDKLEIALFLDTGDQFNLILQKMEVKEYYDSSSSETPDYSGNKESIELATGISAISNGMAFVEIYQKNVDEYEICDFITQSPMGYPYRTTQIPVLVDENGNEYPRIRTASELIKTDSGTDKRFEIYFRNVKSGSYTLKIPCVGLQKSLTTDILNIPLPTGDKDYLECDITALFPDGSGYHITGIERSDYIETLLTVSNNGGDVAAVDIHWWKYRPVYETISPDAKAEFCTAFASGTASNGLSVRFSIAPFNETDSFDSYFFQVQGDEMPEYLSLQFSNPVYLLEQEYLFDITLQE